MFGIKFERTVGLWFVPIAYVILFKMFSKSAPIMETRINKQLASFRLKTCLSHLYYLTTNLHYYEKGKKEEHCKDIYSLKWVCIFLLGHHK